MLRCEPTTDERLAAAFAVLRATGQWLKDIGRHQRVGGTTRHKYEQWQSHGENFVVLEDNHVVGVFSLCRQLMEDWPDLVPAEEVLCLRALATHPQHRHKNIGRFAVEQAIALAQGEPLYLDCVSGFLPQFYESLGFVEIGSQVLEQSAGNFDVRLMRYQA